MVVVGGGGGGGGGEVQKMYIPGIREGKGKLNENNSYTLSNPLLKYLAFAYKNLYKNENGNVS